MKIFLEVGWEVQIRYPNTGTEITVYISYLNLAMLGFDLPDVFFEKGMGTSKFPL